MSSRIEIKENFSFADIAEGIQQEIEREMYGAISDARNEMEDRTKGGKDVNNVPFKPYNPAYAKAKRDGGVFKGKKIKATGKSGKVVDLELTGEMWRGIAADARIEGENAIGEIKTLSAGVAEKVIANEELGRKFFDLTDKQVEEIRRRVIQVINKQ